MKVKLILPRAYTKGYLQSVRESERERSVLCSSQSCIYYNDQNPEYFLNVVKLNNVLEKPFK